MGGVATVTCSNDGGVADRIQIVTESGNLMASEMSVEMLTLTIDPVTDTLHNSDVTCFVTNNAGGADETVFNQTLAITVDGMQSWV